MRPDPTPEGPAALARIRPVSRETLARLERYAELLRRWQPVKNLVAPDTLARLWSRHFADSCAAHDALPEARRWVDLGSGAGFPGLVTAILLADTPGARVDLVESNGRKAAFLATVGREVGAPAVVHARRIEDVAAELAGGVDAVSARALAPLDALLGLAAPLLVGGAVGVFHKGRDLAAEVAAARGRWSFDLVEHPSPTDPEGRIAVVRSLVSSGAGPRASGGQT